MTTNILFDQFDQLITRAGDIPRLNALILQLAVRGQLVPQNPADKPAAELLKRIKAEKARLVKEKKIRKPKKLPPIKADEIPFEVPPGWEWVRLPEIYHDCGQTKPKKTFTYIDVSSINNAVGVIGDDLDVIEPANAPSRARKLVAKGTVIYSTVRPYLLNVAIVDQEFDPPPIVSTAFAVMHPLAGIDNKFLFFYLRSKPFVEFVESQMTGMAYPAISDSKLSKGFFPLPPLAEQRRIVERVEQLLEQSRALEAELAAAEAERAALTRASLHHLTAAPTPAALSEQWQQLAPTFDALLTDPAAVDDLKQAILQLAVQGRLVPQHPTDEPASALLKRIKAEKARLVKEGQIRKSKPLPPIAQEEITYQIPTGWEWVRLQDITKVITCGIASTPKYVEKGMPFLSARNVKPYNFMPDQHKFVSFEAYERITRNAKPEINDILLTRVGAGIGEAAIIDQDIDFAFYVSLTLVKPFFSEVLSPYLLHWLNSPEGTIKSIANTFGKGTSQGNLNVGQVRQFTIPLPPLAEQQRIVERVEQLLALCDDLKAQLAAGESARARLLASLLHGVANGNNED